MGPINPLALEEHAALLERNQFLEEQLEDVRRARRELAKVIRAVDAEIVEVFRAAYADVAENFETLFATLFPGGQGRLRLTDPDHLLETGIEVEARPSGKNVRRLSLLSGGERSLTAMAFLFAVFRSRPSPFYLMDEVEAALDDVNLHRFLDMVHEFRSEAQLLIVSHQKRTMEAADCLYGVTMAPGGIVAGRQRGAGGPRQTLCRSGRAGPAGPAVSVWPVRSRPLGSAGHADPDHRADRGGRGWSWRRPASSWPGAGAALAPPRRQPPPAATSRPHRPPPPAARPRWPRRRPCAEAPARRLSEAPPEVAEAAGSRPPAAGGRGGAEPASRRPRRRRPGCGTAWAGPGRCSPATSPRCDPGTASTRAPGRSSRRP